MLRFRLVAAVGALVGTLALAGGAFAATISTPPYQGTITPSGTVAFDAKIKDGVMRKILGSPGPPTTGLTFDQVPVTCDEGPSEIAAVLVFNVWVGADNHFYVVGKTTDPALHGKLTTQGTFTEDTGSASGTVRVRGDWGDAGTNCDSGRLNWTAAVDTGSGGGDGARTRASSRAPFRLRG
jgi:hypothetical protein